MKLERICSVEGCNGIHLAKGLCAKHYHLFRKGVPFEKLHMIKSIKVCTVDGCSNKHDAKGLCANHYRLYRQGTPIEDLRVIQHFSRCSVDGCFRKHSAKGFCSMHYHRHFVLNIALEDLNKPLPNQKQIIDIDELIGAKYGKWTVLSFVHRHENGTIVLRCQCKCGTKKDVHYQNLRKQFTTQCYECSVKARKGIGYKHGLSKHPLYNSWLFMLRKYKDDIDEGWLDMKRFINEVSIKPNYHSTLTKIDKRKPIGKENYKWVHQGEESFFRQALTAYNVAKLTGYSRERIRQMVESGELETYIEERIALDKVTRVFFKQEVVKYLEDKRRKKEIVQPTLF